MGIWIPFPLFTSCGILDGLFNLSELKSENPRKISAKQERNLLKRNIRPSSFSSLFILRWASYTQDLRENKSIYNKTK